MPRIVCILALLFLMADSKGQTGVGIGIYPTGTEAGFGFRSGKDTRLALDIRAGKASFFKNTKATSLITECNLIVRAVKLEKVRFHVGLGARVDWVSPHSYYGVVMPVGVEAFPFPFQNAGLFFEAAPYYNANQLDNDWRAGIRTVAGCVFYFPVNTKKKGNEKL
jgi:hypothetical protein